MRISILLPYDGSPRIAADQIPHLEATGLDGVWIPEAWGFDGATLAGYLAARTSRITLALGIVNVFSRTPTLIAQTAAGLDHVSRGRAVLGIGTSGPQVIEGWHGVPFEQPLERLADTVATVRQVIDRQTVDRRSAIPPGHGSGLGKPLRLLTRPDRPSIPVAIAALSPRSVRQTAQIADIWLPLFYLPEKAAAAWADPLATGAAGRSADLGRLRVVAGGVLAIEDDVAEATAAARMQLARYIGGMGARGANFYHDLACRYGFSDAADAIQERFLAGDIRGAQDEVPDELIVCTNLIGSPSDVRSRIDAYAAAGVDELMVTLVGDDPVAHVRALRALA